MPQVIILAGGSISNKLGFLRSRCPSPALIPINTRPLAAYLIDFYGKQKDCSVYLVVNADVAETVRAELGASNGRYELRSLVETSGVVDSLTQAIKDILDDEDVIVNLVTTVPTQLVQLNEVLVADQLSQSSYWSGVIFESKQPVFTFKSTPRPASSHAFTGVFRCSAAHLHAAIKATANLKDLLAVIEKLQGVHALRYTTCEWIDCGHETNYYEAKSRLISSRSFNRIRVSLEDGVLRKSSENDVKLQREIDYIQMLPPSVEVYFPRILTHRESTSNVPGSVKTEYYGYPTVAEYFLYWQLSPDNWRRMFSRFKSILQRFKTFPYSIGQSAFQDFYLGKTSQRVGQFLKLLDPDLRQILEGETIVNGHLCRPFSTLEHEIRARLVCMYHERDFCIMHGDFCFSNILYDVPSGIVRLIDPRGSFGEWCVGIHGDQKYDLAKLKHSAEYGYDFFVNGLYSLRCNGRNLDYTLAARECSPLVAELSLNIIAELGYKNADIELLTSLLFLSMCPLHAEDSTRQLAMYAHGLRLLNICLKN
jgi:hypothetical protein